MDTEDVRAIGARARMIRRRELSLDVVAGFAGISTPYATWRLAVGIELGEGAGAYADATVFPSNVQALGSSERISALHLHFSRALAQQGASAAAMTRQDTSDESSN